MQKTIPVGCHQRARTESERYDGVQTFIEIVEDELVEVQSSRGNLLELILSADNLKRSYRQVVDNGQPVERAIFAYPNNIPYR